MSEKEIAVHNIALLYNIHKELHPDDTETKESQQQITEYLLSDQKEVS